MVTLRHSSMLVSAVVILFSLAIPCGCEEEQAFRGTPIGRDDYLWFSAILKGFEDDDYLCSGALISPRHVITADHCLDEDLISNVWVRVGYFCPRSDNCGRTFRIRSVIEHRRDPSLGDVAILVLSSKVPSEFVPAIPDVVSPSYLLSIKKGGEMLMVGAGRDGSSESVSKRAETLQIQLGSKSYKKCRKAISSEEVRKRVVSRATICSVSSEGKPCQGDSGSAVLVDAPDASGDVIVAVHNYGPSDCSGADDKLLFGHVALSAVANFVISVVCVGNNQENWCRPTCTADILGTCCSTMSCPPSPTVLPMPEVAKRNSLRATVLYHLADHENFVYSLAFDSTSFRLASGDAGTTVHVWDPSIGGSPLMSFELVDSFCVETLAFNPAGTMLAVGDGHFVTLLDVSNTNSPNEPRKLQGHEDDVDAVAWHPNGEMLASGSSDTTIKLWDVASGNVLHTFEGHSRGIESVSFHWQGQYLASSSSDVTIRIWDLSTLQHVRTMHGHTSAIYSMSYSPDGTMLASGSWDKTVRIWRASDGVGLATFLVGSSVTALAWSPDSQFVAVGSIDAIVRVWDVIANDEEPLLSTFSHCGWVESVAWSPNGKWIASGSDDTTVGIWEVTVDQCR